MDLRGFGDSGVTPGIATMEHLADDLAVLLEELKIEQRVAFCGLSMGGYVAWQFWQRHGDHLARLILCDTRAVADSEDVAQIRLETAEQVLSDGPQSLADGMIEKLLCQATRDQQSEIVETVRNVMLATDPEGIAAALRGMARREDFSNRLGEIDVPTLVICGEHDAISTAEEMRDIAANIRDASYVEIPDAGHMSPLENAVAVNNAIDEFLM
jgi:pimeloyl-ACP methyl ester carboxylesterase